MGETGGYIADFGAGAGKLIIEVDGDTYAGNEAPGPQRMAVLEREGDRVLRFTNADVMQKEAGVLEAMAAAPAAAPLAGGETELLFRSAV